MFQDSFKTLRNIVCSADDSMVHKFIIIIIIFSIIEKRKDSSGFI